MYSGDGDREDREYFAALFKGDYSIFEMEQENLTHKSADAYSKLDRIYANYGTHDQMDKHIECFMLLVKITVIVMSAGDVSASIIAELRVAVDRHAQLYSVIYLHPKMYKVKWHHLIHLPDDLLRLGKFLSCFPMERKHKSIKVHMVNSFASIEQTTVYNHLNAMMISIIRGDIQS